MVPANDNDSMTFGTPTQGSIYIVQVVGEDNINYCEFGLRVNLTVQSHDCSSDETPSLCSAHGTCEIETYNQSTYSCVCEYGYYGQYCEEYDACLTNPCEHGGECTDVTGGDVSANFTCVCLDGYSGKKSFTEFEKLLILC